MRDEKDPGTLEMDLPRKRGRPAKHSSGAMSPAERARLYRYRKKWGNWKELSEISDASLIDRLKWAMRQEPDPEDGLVYADLYIEELARRHHSKGASLFK